jgi:hypothetical protein
MRVLTKVVLALALAGVIATQVVGSRQRASASGIEPQDPAYLDRRINMLETRLGSIESSLRMLSQQAMSQRSDERTLSAGAKEARKRINAQANDPCRLNPETPVQLSTRR